MDHRELIVRPLLTEKGTHIKETENKYLFEVAVKANKIQIKRAIEEIFDVRVKKVATMNRLGKMKRVRIKAGRRPNWKKAIVTLAEGHTLEFFEGA
ncbi:MAG: 50S ribosomal protein L23 [Gemmatimonadetes bacterium]|nr:50S ribosomal protein L23 [Gemmatimonadota bacterium]